MKLNTPQRTNRAFTLIEMLVVIAIIGILAGILLPVIASSKAKAKIVQAKTEMKNLAVAISAFQAQYSIFPTSDTDARGGVDMTYTNGNSDIIRILLDVDEAGTVNEGHKRNPQKTVFLNGKMVQTGQPGIGKDYNFRDPWGTPYVITLDLNYDNACEDKIYGKFRVPVMIWSYGPNRIPGPFGSGGNPDVKENDDVRSW